ncbi:hypothetical protein FOA52_010794 [Chlamydomonas sp. UWO 241]|nr:hypothetical protein FOA52_010794 [Chlamydomonas sp. UWO 241]
MAHFERLDAYEASRRPFLDVDIAGSLVYLDAGAGEVASTSLGLSFVLGLGAQNVCSLEGASARDALAATVSAARVTTPRGTSGASDTPPGSSLTLFVTRLVTDAHAHIVRAVTAHAATVRSVTIFSSVSEHAHACQAATELGAEAFSEYAAMLKDDLQASCTPTLTVRHLPMHVCALDASTCVLPAASAAAGLARSGGCAAGLSPPDARDMSAADGEGGQGGCALLAHEVAGLVQQLGAKMEVWALGPTSQMVAAEAVQLPLPLLPELLGRPTPTLGVILIDRFYDLVSPCSHGDHPLDAIMAATPRGAAASEFAAARASSGGSAFGSSGGGGAPTPVCEWRPAQPLAIVPVASPVPMELSNPGDRAAMGRVAQLVACKKGRDALTLLRRWLKESIRAERMTPSVRPKAGVAELINEIASLVSDLSRPPDAGPALPCTKTADASAPSERRSSSGGGLQLPLSTPGFTPSTPSSGCPALRHRGVLALAAAAVGASGGAAAHRWEAAGTLERSALAMLVQAGDTSGLASILIEAVGSASAGRGPLRVSDVLQILPYVYSLWGDAAPPQASGDSCVPFSQQEERDLLQAVGKATMASLANDDWAQQLDCFPPGTLAQLRGMCVQQGGEGRKAAQKEARAILQAFFTRLGHVARARLSLPSLRSLSVVDMFGDAPVTVMPLLRRLARACTQRTDIPDLVQTASSGALSGLISKGLAGFGRLGGMMGGGTQKRTQPWQCDAVLIFMVGGISASEVRGVRSELEDAVQKQGGEGEGVASGPQIMLAGTALVSPRDVACQLLVRKRGAAIGAV